MHWAYGYIQFYRHVISVTTFPAAKHHRAQASVKLCCLMTEAGEYERLAQGCCSKAWRPGVEPGTYAAVL